NQIGINAEKLLKVSEALEVDMNELFGGLANSNFYINNNQNGFIYNFIEAQQEANEKQNNLIEKLIVQNEKLILQNEKLTVRSNEMTEKLMKLFEVLVHKK